MFRKPEGEIGGILKKLEEVGGQWNIPSINLKFITLKADNHIEIKAFRSVDLKMPVIRTANSIPQHLLGKIREFCNAKVALVGPSVVNRKGTIDAFLSTPSFPIGINALYGILREGSREVRVFDPDSQQVAKELIDFVSGEKVILGISPLHETIDNDVYLVERVRESAGDVLAVAGGIEASIFPEFFLSHKVAELIFRGPAEYAFRDFLSALDGNQIGKIAEIPGILFLDTDGERILSTGELSYSARQFEETIKVFPWDTLSLADHVQRSDYEIKFPTSFLQCGHSSCSFCSIAAFRRTFKSASRILAISQGLMIDKLSHISDILRSQGIDPGRITFYLQDEDATRDIQRLKALAQALIDAKEEQGIAEETKFSVKARFGLLDKEVYRLLKKSGFAWLGLGLEHYDETVLGRDGMQKGFRLDDVNRTLDLMLEHGIQPVVFTVLFPLEATPDSVKATLDQIVSIRNRGCLVKARVFTSLYPGTVYYNRRKDLAPYIVYRELKVGDGSVTIPWTLRPSNEAVAEMSHRFDEAFPMRAMGGLVIDESDIETLERIIG